VAQLGARLDGIEEVVGSNPIGSTIFQKNSDSENFKGHSVDFEDNTRRTTLPFASRFVSSRALP
jgi:hypothetical protein